MKTDLNMTAAVSGEDTLYRLKRTGMRLGRRVLDRCGEVIAQHSECGDQPTFDPAMFAWCRRLEDSDEDRVVLFLDVMRPLPWAWDLGNRLFVNAVAWSPFVQDGVKRFRERDGHGAPGHQRAGTHAFAGTGGRS